MPRNVLAELEKKQQQLDDTVGMVSTAAAAIRKWLSEESCAVEAITVKAKETLNNADTLLSQLKQAQVDLNERYSTSVEEIKSARDYALSELEEAFSEHWQQIDAAISEQAASAGRANASTRAELESRMARLQKRIIVLYVVLGACVVGIVALLIWMARLA